MNMPPRILVINNTDEGLVYFQQVLANINCQFLVRFIHNTSIRDVCEISPNLIIIDREIEGNRVNWELLRQLKMDRRTKDTPVIICTSGVRQAEEISTYLAAKHVTVLHKPFDERDLLRTLKTHLRSYPIEGYSPSTHPHKTYNFGAVQLD